ncbi:glycoside hydrolase family 26 protein [Spirosoma areae]
MQTTRKVALITGGAKGIGRATAEIFVREGVNVIIVDLDEEAGRDVEDELRFHEMNGSWFWWGANDAETPTNLADFKQLWQDMHQTFTSMGLDNLVWVYAANNPFSPVTREAVLTMYPGDAYVDVVGMDIYKAPVPDFTENYKILQKLNKPIVVAECGDDIDNQGVKVLDELEIIRQYRGKAGYFMQWHSWTNGKLSRPGGPVKVRRAIIDNPNARDMMNHPSAVTLDEMR